MDAIWKSTLDAYLQPLYDRNPEGELLESIKSFEKRFIEVANQNEGNMDFVGVLSKTGLQDEYNQLYMAAMNRNNSYKPASGEDAPKVYDASKTNRLPTVHEFLDAYRLVYEQVRPNARETTNKAYEELLDVENRTDDLIEAQIIIEKEGLILNTVTADYKYIAEDFLEATDPNYEVTSATVKSSIGVYATAKSVDEITYMGEVARGVTDDIAVQVQLKVEMMVIFYSLVFAWEKAKSEVRAGGPKAPANAAAMVVTREKMRKYYRFMAEDMGLSFEVMEKTPFYRIMMLNPSGLDELWRLKKVMHPDNIEAIRYILFEEILSDRSLEDILLTPQSVPFYMPIDTHTDGDIDSEFGRIAEELNRDLKFFQRNRDDSKETFEKDDKNISSEKLLKKVKNLNTTLASAANKAYDMTSGNGLAGKIGGKASPLGAMKGIDPATKKSMGKDMAKGIAETAVKDIGRGLLRGLFKR